MKKILQEIFIFGFALYVTSQIFPGLKVGNGFFPLIIGGVLLAIGFLIVKPIVTIISFPFQFITFGLFSIITSAIVLFLVTLVYGGIKVVSFQVPSFSILNFEIKSFHAGIILSYCIISVTIYIISKVILWLFDNQ